MFSSSRFHKQLRRSLGEDPTTSTVNPTADELSVAINMLVPPRQENVDLQLSSGRRRPMHCMRLTLTSICQTLMVPYQHLQWPFRASRYVPCDDYFTTCYHLVRTPLESVASAWVMVLFYATTASPVSATETSPPRDRISVPPSHTHPLFTLLLRSEPPLVLGNATPGRRAR